MKRLAVAITAALLLAGGLFASGMGDAASVSASTPCVGAQAPATWHHVVVVMFENTSQDSSGHVSGAPFVNGLVDKCGHSAKWNDANYKVDGTKDGSYNSKPSYAVLTNGQPGSVTGITSDSYTQKTGVDNLYNQLRLQGRDATSYVEGRASGDVCSGGGSSSGSYHDPIRYYTNLPNAWCNAHSLDLSKFDPANLPAFSMIIPKNTSNWHDNSISSGDTWAKNFLTPLLNSSAYASGDTAVFFLTDEESPVVNALIAPSVKPGSTVTSSGNPISHYAGLRTFEDMLGVPYLGQTAKAPSLIDFFGGTGTTTTTQPTTTTTGPPTTTSTVPPSTTTTVPPPPPSCASAGTWSGLAAYAHVVSSGCIDGGTVMGTNPWTDPWDTFHRSAGWVIRGPVAMLRTAVVNLGDGYHVESGSFLLSHVAALSMHDDAIENDRHRPGIVADSTFTSYVSYSDAGENSTDGSATKVTLQHNYFELTPIPGVYKPDKYPSPGTGPWFKTDANSATVNLIGNVFVASQAPNHGTLDPPVHLGTCTKNTVIWRGPGAFPARAAWLAKCPDIVFGS